MLLIAQLLLWRVRSSHFEGLPTNQTLFHPFLIRYRASHLSIILGNHIIMPHDDAQKFDASVTIQVRVDIGPRNRR